MRHLGYTPHPSVRRFLYPMFLAQYVVEIGTAATPRRRIVKYARLDLPQLHRDAHFFTRIPHGPTVSTYVVGGFHPDIRVRIEQKITNACVKNGKLIPFTSETIKRRGGKRHINSGLTLEYARALHASLGKALEEADRRIAYARRLEQMIGVLYECIQKDSDAAPDKSRPPFWKRLFRR